MRLQRGTKVINMMKNDDMWMVDPVHAHDGLWWFWDESWSKRIGPYLTKESAHCGLDNYLKWLNKDKKGENGAHS